MASIYAEDELGATKVAGLIGDGAANVSAGIGIMTTNQTTLVIAHSFAGAPDFLLFSSILKPEATQIAVTSNTTAVTFTRNTAATSWSVCFVIGYTA